jgi:hypothetical protein
LEVARSEIALINAKKHTQCDGFCRMRDLYWNTNVLLEYCSFRIMDVRRVELWSSQFSTISISIFTKAF